MSRHEITAEGTIAASPAKVYEILADQKRIAEWMPNVSSAKPLNTAKGVGAKRSIEMRIGSLTMESRQKVTDAEPGKRFAWVHEEDRVNGEVFEMLEDVGTVFELAAHGKETRIRATSHFSPKGFKAKLAAPLFTKDVRKQMTSAIENLKRIAEKK